MKRNNGIIINNDDIRRCLQYSHIVCFRLQAVVNIIFKYNKLSGDDAVKLEVLSQNAFFSLNNAILSTQKYVLHFERGIEINNEVPLYILSELAIAYKSFNEFFKSININLVKEHEKIGTWKSLDEMKKLRDQMEHRENNHKKHEMITMSSYSGNTDGVLRFDVWGYKKIDNTIHNTIIKTVENCRIHEYTLILSEYMLFETDHLFEFFDKEELNQEIMKLQNQK